ncbi:hypothetical protein BJ742DRAFT_676895 [Cladochytrium replicatum]|nr:hypothetical protein BJ742DRAFT_676895 [Cladochytrium replicatum]
MGSPTDQPPGEAPMQIHSIPRSFAKTLPTPVQEDQCYAGVIGCIGSVLGCLGSVPCLFCFPNPFRTVNQGNVGLITRWGQYYRTVDAGYELVNHKLMSPKFLKMESKTEVKIQLSDIPQQFVMTKDNCNVKIDSVLYWHIIDPVVSAFEVADVRKALTERTQTTLRHILGTRTLQDIIENREVLAREIESIIAGPAASWGVKIESILIKDIQFSQELQETLSSAAKQKRVGESKVIAAAAEVEAAKLMREASDILNTPAAMQIRYLETLNSMAKSAGAKVIFMPTSTDGPHSNLRAVMDRSVLETIGEEKH